MCVCGSELPPLHAQVLVPAEHRCNVCSKAGQPPDILSCDGIKSIGSHKEALCRLLSGKERAPQLRI